MAESLRQLYGRRLMASDGEIGHVKDFYFDDKTWAVRYLVADTGTWLPGRQVLITPHPLEHINKAGPVLRVNLAREQIEKSPLIASHKAVSRHYEEQYYQYYGWPRYWKGRALWGVSDVPLGESPATAFPSESAPANGPEPDPADVYLRSAKAVVSEGTIGHVCDFMMDADSWAIRQLIIKAGYQKSGTEIQQVTIKVDLYSYGDFTKFDYLSG